MNDWEVLGYDSYMCPWSILSYHFTMVDNFSKMPKALILRMLNSLNWEKGWTLRGCPSPNPHVYMEWIDYFGQNPARTELIREWLQNQTIMQLVASTCVYNEFMDYNIAFFMAIATFLANT